MKNGLRLAKETIFNSHKDWVYTTAAHPKDSFLPFIPARLEDHYYHTILPDLISLTYNHKKQTKLNALNAKSDIPDVFTTQLKDLPTTNNTTSNLFTTINCLNANKVFRKKYSRKIFNPIDYTPINAKYLNENLTSGQTREIFDPLISTLPFIKRISLQIYSEAAIGNKQLLYSAIMSLSAITGKRAEPLFAKDSDAVKKIREGMAIGAKVSLNGREIYEFLDKLKETVLPRLREWEGFSPKLNSGAITIRLPEAAIGYFPDIEPHFDMFPRLFDTDISIETNVKSEDLAIKMLSGFGLPFAEHKIVKAIKKEDGDPLAKFKNKKNKNKIKSN